VQHINEFFKNAIKNKTFSMYFLASKFIMGFVVEPFLTGFGVSKTKGNWLFADFVAEKPLLELIVPNLLF
jgi:hypothetical protein